ncbi:hypothetical protein QWT87_03230 [Chryseobacterium sp. APV1]|uniref:DUF6705 domain-containing protein n=1 Tax=Chryseobacterium urinae TaxID=3058400 RepID=A0ABT8TYQ0_9FLAO|nr:DUF6705 family protein [Chryseobacterium sp. APV1]MDO3423888.1 hypothetical protein [Chryseobacterium sp. APV1]
MKNTLALITFTLIISCNAQIYPLRTYSIVPSNSYIKDLNSELLSYEGMWTANWNGKVFFIELKKVKKYFTHLDNNPYYMDVLIGKFKVTDSNGQVLFDNTSIPDNNAKVVGGKIFSPTSTKYSLRYIDPEICGMNGLIMINFTDSTKTKLNWKFSDMTDIITVDCQYYNTNPFPQPLPKNIILTKQ